jgi:alanyl-tRNA synthetase
VENTSDIWHFKITSESAIASGIRRIEAISFDALEDYYLNQEKEFTAIKIAMKNPQNPVKFVAQLQEENVKLKKEVEQLLKEKAGTLKDVLIKEVVDINGVNFLTSEINMDNNTIKNLAVAIGEKVDNLFFINGSSLDGKAFLTLYISKDLVEEKNLNAGSIIRELGPLIQGGGGGQVFYATAGGKNPNGIKQALVKVREFII